METDLLIFQKMGKNPCFGELNLQISIGLNWSNPHFMAINHQALLSRLPVQVRCSLCQGSADAWCGTTDSTSPQVGSRQRPWDMAVKVQNNVKNAQNCLPQKIGSLFLISRLLLVPSLECRCLSMINLDCAQHWGTVS